MQYRNDVLLSGFQASCKMASKKTIEKACNSLYTSSLTRIPGTMKRAGRSCFELPRGARHICEPTHRTRKVSLLCNSPPSLSTNCFSVLLSMCPPYFSHLERLHSMLSPRIHRTSHSWILWCHKCYITSEPNYYSQFTMQTLFPERSRSMWKRVWLARLSLGQVILAT